MRLRNTFVRHALRVVAAAGMITSVPQLGAAERGASPAAIREVGDPEPAGDVSCRADIDQDGVVDGYDLAILLAGYGRCPGCAQDLNGDSAVDREDIDILFGSWGTDPCPQENAPAPCAADLDADGAVDHQDLAILLGRFGPCVGCAEDLSGDGIVDEDDVVVLLSKWGPGPCTAYLAEPCIGDFDASDAVDHADLAVLLSRSGPCAGCEEDLSGDGVVDRQDIELLHMGWGSCTPQPLYEDEFDTSEGERPAIVPPPAPSVGIGGEVPGGLVADDGPAGCAADFDANGSVDHADLARLLGQFGPCETCREDLSGDRTVDQQDIDLLHTQWGPCAQQELYDDAPDVGGSEPPGVAIE